MVCVEEVPPPAENELPDSKVPSKKKKKVSWASTDKLTQTFYFELDESERGKETHFCVQV